MNKKDLLNLLEQNEFKPDTPPPDEQVIFRIQFKTIGSLGDFVLFSGRPKSGKTKFLSGAISSSICGQSVYDMHLKLPIGKQKVAHFDTEQSKYSHYKMMQLIRQLAEFDTFPAHFKSYRCRSVAPAQIVALVECYLNIHPDTGIIFLDGLLDIVTSMNDEKHSNFIKQWLKRITEEHNILLVGVIHRGFSNDKSIGQIGSEGERAAQSVLLVEKNKETRQYILRAEYLRDADEFEPIAIYYNKQLSLWQQCDFIDNTEEKQPGKTRNLKRRPYEYDISEHTANVVRIFNSNTLYSYATICQRIIEVYGVGRSWAKECVPVLEKENLIFRTSEGYTNIRQGRLLKVE